MFKSRFILFIVDISILLLLNIPLGNGILLSLIISLLMTLGAYAFRCYDQDILASGRNTLYRVFLGALFGLIPFYLAYPFLRLDIRALTILYNIIICSVSLSLIHKIVYRFYLKKRPAVKYLVIGGRSELLHILHEITRRTLHKLVFFPYGNNTSLNPDEFKKRFDAILVLDTILEEKMLGPLSNLKAKGIRIHYLPMLCEEYLKRIPVEVIQKNPNYYKLAFESIEDQPLIRVIDILVSIVLLILLSPVILLASMIICLEDGFPVRFSQRRVGRNGTVFKMHKLRTLRETDVDAKNPNKDIETRSLWIGKILRKTRIDESLQFINVLKGEMSIVGPRPEMIPFHSSASGAIPLYSYRLRVKPGITGWAQLSYKHTSTMDDYKVKTGYDLYYIKNRSILLDIKIMLKTFETMIGLRGAR